MLSSGAEHHQRNGPPHRRHQWHRTAPRASVRKHGHRLILVAPESDELLALAANLENSYGTETLTAADDLEDSQSGARLLDACSAKGWRVDILANNAGHGYRGAFAEPPLRRIYWFFA